MSDRIAGMLSWAGRVSAVAVVVLGLAGCGSLNKTHTQHVNAAEGRWRAARSDLMLKMAQRQFDAGDLDQAQKTLTEAVGLDPANAHLHLLAGRIALERGKLEHASHLFRYAIELDEKCTDAYYYYGLVLQRWQQYDNALVNYLKSYELKSDNPAYLIAAAEMYVALDRWDDALVLLHSKLTIFDQNAGIRVAIGQIHLVRNDYAKAVDYFRQAQLLRPDDTQITEALISARIGAGQVAEATDDLERLLRQPDYAQRRDLHRVLAECYTRQRRFQDAKQTYVNLTRTDPTDVDTWSKLGETALELGDHAGALLAANRVKALAPRRHEGYLLSGIVLQKRGQVERALIELDRAAELAPDSAAPVIMRGLVLESTGRRTEAAAAYTEALVRKPDDAQARQLLANVSARGAD